jgi:hypothetical protein
MAECMKQKGRGTSVGVPETHTLRTVFSENRPGHDAMFHTMIWSRGWQPDFLVEPPRVLGGLIVVDRADNPAPTSRAPRP